MMKLTVLLALSICLVEGRHFHPRSIVKTGEESSVDGIPIDVIRNIKPNRFVPINNALFFSGPCEEGFERDLIGVCREVWD